MKKLIASLYIIICIFMCGGLVAQNNNTKAVKSKEIPPAIIEPDAINNRE